MVYTTDGKGKSLDDPASKVWYHGSPLLLEVLNTGSSITRNRELAIAFSHKPTWLSVSDEGEIDHNGEQNGYLYEVIGPVSMEDIYVHPKVQEVVPDDPWEWLTKKPFRLKLIEKTIVKSRILSI